MGVHHENEGQQVAAKCRPNHLPNPEQLHKFQVQAEKPHPRDRAFVQCIDISGEFPITIITKSFFPTCPHLGFRKMLDRSWRDWMSLGNHISEWNKSGFGALLSPDIVLHQLIQL